MVLIWCAFTALSAWAAAPIPSLELPVPAGKIAKLRVYEEMIVGGVKHQVLVGKHLVPENSVVRIELKPLLYRWLVNDLGKIVQSSMPYFSAKVMVLPEGHEFLPGEREEILAGSFYVHIRDLEAARIVAALFPEALPIGEEKNPHVFSWDAYNPSGTWSHAVQRALSLRRNSFLVNRPPRDMEDFCPRFASLLPPEKEIFWVTLFNEIARYESAFIPLAASDEGIYDPSNKGVISSGLMQVSIRSSRAACYQGRGCGSVKKQADLFSPEKNLRCALGIMSCLSEAAGCLSCKTNGRWRGIAAYWSTMRDPYDLNCPTCPSGKVTIGKKPQIREAMRTRAAFCF